MSTGRNVKSHATVTVYVQFEPGEWVITAASRGRDQEFTVRQQEITFTLRANGDVSSHVRAVGSKRTKTGWHALSTSLWGTKAEDWSGVRSEVMAELERALGAMKP